MEIHERIKATRIDKDIKQDEIAKALKTTRQQIYKYESGIQEMSATRLKQLCEYYNVSADYILGLQKDMPWPR